MGILNSGVSRLLLYVAIRHLGANQAETLQSTTALLAFLLAVTLLHEDISTEVLVGGILIVAGSLIVGACLSADNRHGNPTIGVVSALLSSLVSALVLVLIKAVCCQGISIYPQPLYLHCDASIKHLTLQYKEAYLGPRQHTQEHHRMHDGRILLNSPLPNLQVRRIQLFVSCGRISNNQHQPNSRGSVKPSHSQHLCDSKAQNHLEHRGSGGGHTCFLLFNDWSAKICTLSKCLI